MSVQNPTIPTATQAKGIDSIILDLQTHLDTELVWLTNGMGRAYRLTKVRTDQTTVFLPEVYLGVANRYDYFAATPDNDKQGQNVFFVGDATMPDQQKGFYGWLEYEVGIIFNANLELIDSALLATEDFTEHLIQDVREALIRDLVGKSYRLTIDSITREFDDVYAEFDVSRDRGVAHAPMTHFRVNCTITFREDCAGVSLDRCAAILQNLSTDDKLNCILPTYDFSTTAVQDATTAQQQTDLSNWLCGGVSTPLSWSLDGTNEGFEVPINAAYEFEYNSTFTFAMWVKFTTVKIANLVNKYTTAGADRGYFWLTLAGGEIRMDLQNDGFVKGLSVQTSAGVVTSGSWLHLAMTYSGTAVPSGIKLYKDSASQALSTNSNTLGSNTILNNTIPLRFGNSFSFVNGVNGLIADLRIWNVELSGAEVTSEYNSGTPLASPVQNANLVLHNKGATDALYGTDTWVGVEDTGTVTGVQSLNMESGDTSVDVP